MLKVSKRDIQQGYKGIKHLAKKAVGKKDYDTAINYVGKCAIVAQQFNFFYSDFELENILEEVAKDKLDTGLSANYRANDTNWVFFDDYCTSYVLTLQWVNALSKSGRKILYITSQFTFEGRKDKCILSEIEKMPNVVVDVVPGGNSIERANYLYRAIINFNASKVILHKAMNSIIQMPLCVLPKEITVYNINLGDQFFWLGVKHIDYNLEFRPFGASVSLQQRGFKKEQLLMVPFYPANENRPFEGFPQGCENKIVIFSGGDYYKTWDTQGTYWKLIKQVLDKHDDVVFVFATKRNPKGDKEIMDFIKKNHFEDKFFYINYRQDIFQVFAHCDIYWGTCPISGSLMSQLAAINRKPILQYYYPGTPDDETEQAICINKNIKISFSEEDEFLREADLLIENKEYREKQGSRLKESMMSEEQFKQIAIKTLETNETQLEINYLTFDYKLLDDRWLMLEESGFTNIGSYFDSVFKGKGLFYYPKLLFVKKQTNRILAVLSRITKRK